MRIHRALARAGVASRRHAEEMIAEGRVLINGVIARVGQSVQPGRDRVQLDGKPIDLEPPRATWFVLNKPAGFMTTRSDPEKRRTVFELVPDVPALTYVGRLDFLTEGVLLLTTDGEAAHRLTHPSAEIERVYVATVRGNAKAAAEAARAGVELDDGLVKPAWVNVLPLENRFWSFEIAIREGRTREIRRLCAALGLEVSHLVRTQFGPVRIGQLAPGAWRELSPREAAMLEVFTGTQVPAGKPPRRRDDREHPRRDGNSKTRSTTRSTTRSNTRSDTRSSTRSDTRSATGRSATGRSAEGPSARPPRGESHSERGARSTPSARPSRAKDKGGNARARVSPPKRRPRTD